MKEDFSHFIMFISFLGMIFLFKGCTGCMGCDSHRPVSTSSSDNDYLRYRLDHDAVKRILNYNDKEKLSRDVSFLDMSALQQIIRSEKAKKLIREKYYLLWAPLSL